MTTSKPETAGHHLFWVQGPQNIRHYGYGAGGEAIPADGGLDIFQLRARFKPLVTALDLWVRGRPFESLPGCPEARGLRQLLAQVDQGASFDVLEARKRLHLLFMQGSGEFFRAVRALEPRLTQALTPAYRQLVHAIDLTLPKRHELVFQSAAPDMYLWLPPAAPWQTMLVCFTTNAYTLNVTLPLIHFELARLNLPLLYVKTPAQHPAKGLKGIGLDQTASLIQWVMRRFGIQRANALGTSVGGYLACLMAPRMGFERILNFSGTTGQSIPGHTIWSIDPAYDRDRILTVFSSTDPVDQRLLKEYQAGGFQTPLQFVSSPMHGTLTAAVIEQKHPELFRWVT